MRVDFRYDVNQDYIYIKIHGTYMDGDVKDYYYSIKELSDKHNCQKFIVDYRDLDYLLSPTTIASLPDYLKAYDIESGFRYAMVIDPQTETAEKFKLSEANYDVKIFLNKISVTYDVFNNIEDAENWLLKISQE